MTSFIDARDLPEGETRRADVCLVGAGAAGITVARALRDSGLSVALAEGGGETLDQRTQSLYAGGVIGEWYEPLDVTRLRLLGGSTNHWEGWCLPLDPIDFERRRWVPWSGWPIGFDDLSPYYQRAQDICELGPFEYGDAAWADEVGLPPLPVDEERLSRRVFQRSPPTRFGARYGDDLLEDPTVDVYLNANVVNVERDRSGTRVARVRVRQFDGRSLFFEADRFVLAMGGLENPRLLLASHDDHGERIGNDHDLVGRFFMEHSHLAVGHVTTGEAEAVSFYTGTHEARGGNVRGSFGLPDDLQRRESLLNAHVLLWEVGAIGQRTVESSPLVGGVRTLLEDVHDHRWRDLTRVTVIAEQAPNPASRVTLNGERDALGMRRIDLDWRFRPKDRQVIRRCAGLAAEQLGAIGVGRMHSLVHGPERQWPRIRGGSHHMGTTRMHPDPRKGVVDSDCRVHGLENLYVTGSSVFPTGGMANPTLTVVAMALRLADHLEEAQ